MVHWQRWGVAWGGLALVAGLGVVALAGPATLAVADGPVWVSLGPEGGHVFQLAVSPADPDVLYAATYMNGVFVSQDGGDHWARYGAGLEAGDAYRVAADPVDSGTAYMGAYFGASLYKTTNYGVQWASIGPTATTFLPQVSDVAIDPDTPARVFMARYDGLHLTTDGGATWQPFTAPGLASQPSDLTFHPVTPTTMYAAVSDSLGYRSLDDGAHWDPVPGFRELSFDPVTPTTLYTLFPNSLRRSLDLGTTWITVTAALPGDNLWSLVIDPTSAAHMWAAGVAGPYISWDGGLTWTLANTGLLARTVVDHILVDPEQPTRLWLNTGTMGIYRSLDGGLTWQPANTGMNAVTILDFTFDPQDPLHLFAAASNGAYASPNSGHTWLTTGLTNWSSYETPLVIHPVTPTTLYLAGNEFNRSVDGGDNWDHILIGLPPGPGLRFTMVSPLTPTTLFVGGQYGVYVSSNGGEAWQVIDDGNLPLPVAALVYDVAQTAHMLILGPTGLARSLDGGATWLPVGPAGGGFGHCLVADHTLAAVAYACHQDGLYKTTDGGDTWTLWTVAPLPTVDHLAQDPANSAIMYAASFTGDVARSADGGETWTPLPSLTYDFWFSVQGLAVDPASPTRLLVGTTRGAFALEQTGPGLTPTTTASPTATATGTPSPTPTGTATLTPTPTASATASPTATASVTSTWTGTATRTPTATPTRPTQPPVQPALYYSFLPQLYLLGLNR